LLGHLNKFCNLCQSDEVVLFEKATFLVISHATHRIHEDIHRYEKISNIIKQFKLSCSKSQSQFYSMEVQNKLFTAFIDQFTTNTYIMIIISNPKIRK
jgi:Ras-related GTP-binding protein A/B